jgi:hypothetical protein
MSNVVSVAFQGQDIGSVTFELSPRYFNAQRTAAGFALWLPFTVRLKMAATGAPAPLLSNISAWLRMQTPEGVVHHLGYARCDISFLGSVPESATSGELLWADSLAALAFYEEIRDGKPPHMLIDFRADVCNLMPMDPRSPVPGRQIRSSPWPVVSTVDVTYPTEVWGQMLRQLKVLDIVFVQIPLPSNPPTGWDVVWRALEAWNKIEPEKPWPPTKEEREALAKTERFDRLRWSLHQAAHPAAHASQETWSREDAQLMLSTLSALLRQRNP